MVHHLGFLTFGELTEIPKSTPLEWTLCIGTIGLHAPKLFL